ncbi:MAG: ATP-binding protein [Candidatus Methanomethyliaceae archaeon]
MSKRFWDVVEELRLLQERVGSKSAEFIIIYGRRKIGKTALILEFIRRDGGIHLLVRSFHSKFHNRFPEYYTMHRQVWSQSRSYYYPFVRLLREVCNLTTSPFIPSIPYFSKSAPMF